MPQPRLELRHHLFSLKFRQLSSCLETPVSEASGLLSAVTKVFRETGRSRPPGGPLSCRACVGLDGSAAKAQTVINVPSRFAGANGYITLENPLVGGAIHLVLSQCGWRL